MTFTEESIRIEKARRDYYAGLLAPNGARKIDTLSQEVARLQQKLTKLCEDREIAAEQIRKCDENLARLGRMQAEAERAARPSPRRGTYRPVETKLDKAARLRRELARLEEEIGLDT